MPPMPPSGNANDDAISPLAQVKLLRVLQAELNERTAAFARAHPNLDKLNDDEREELQELERAQREIGTLFEEIAALFQPNMEAP